MSSEKGVLTRPNNVRGHVLPDGSNMVGTVKSFDPAKARLFIGSTASCRDLALSLHQTFQGTLGSTAVSDSGAKDIYFKPDPSKAEAFSPGQEAKTNRQATAVSLAQVTFLLKYAADGRPQAREALLHGPCTKL